VRQVELSVTGMGCRRCIREVTACLRDVPGIRTVAADPARRVVVVRGEITDEAVRAALDETSYVSSIISSGPDDDCSGQTG
jgi:copper chaperone CopZ